MDNRIQTKEELVEFYEKKLYTSDQLLEVSISLSSSLDYNVIIESILYTCMGHMQVSKVGLFTKRNPSDKHFTMHRNCKGFDTSHNYAIKEKSQIVEILGETAKVFEYSELKFLVGKDEAFCVFDKLNPDLILPLKIKDKLTGILFISDRVLKNLNYNQDEKLFLYKLSRIASTAIQNALLYEMATTDMMTKLKLRHFFFASLAEHQERSFEQNNQLSLIMLDIDHFKLVNDTYGHAFGDLVIKKIAFIIRKLIRQLDIPCRYGGEEFIVMLPETSKEKAAQVAERIRAFVQKTEFSYKNIIINVTISLGVAAFSADSDLGTRNLVEKADLALYESKNNGRNKVTVKQDNTT